MNNSKQSLEDITKEILLDLGVPVQLKGYRYLMEAVAAVAKSRNILRVNVKELYRQVATAHNDTDSGVETAIRQAIDETWNSDGTGFLPMFFGYGSDSTSRPGNEEFIIFVADRVQMTKKCQ